MFFIYGRKDELENDSWFGEMECSNCGTHTKHMFKLHKRYPTLFFVKIPLGRVIKRYLVCTQCGANRVVKKSEYDSIKQSSAIAKQMVESKPKITEQEVVTAEQKAPITGQEVVTAEQKAPITEQEVIAAEQKAPVTEQKVIATDQNTITAEQTLATDKTKAEESGTGKFGKIAIGLIAVLIGVLLHQASGYLSDQTTTEKNTTKKITTTEQTVIDREAVYSIAALLTTTEQQTTQQNRAFTEGFVVGNTYYNNWLNIEFEVPENYTEASEDFYEALKSQSSDEYGMYFISDDSYSVAIGFADLKQEPYLTENEFLNAVAEETKAFMSEYGNCSIGYIYNYFIAQKNFKGIHITTDFGLTSSIYVYKQDDIMCYINVSGENQSINDALVSSIESLY